MKTKGKRYGGIDRYLLKNRRAMHSSALLDAIGAQGHPVAGRLPIPKDFSVETSVTGDDGTAVVIRIKKSSGRMGRRVFAVCPECGTEVCAGHLHQHVEARHA